MKDFKPTGTSRELRCEVCGERHMFERGTMREGNEVYEVYRFADKHHECLRDAVLVDMMYGEMP